MDAPEPIQWYYADHGEQRGPFSGPEWEAMIASGTVTGATLVWNAGLAGWVAWESLATPPVSTPEPPPRLEGSNTPSPHQVTCSECGGQFATEDTIPYGNRRVCAACKPAFLQRLAEGAALGHAGGNHLTPEEVAEADYPLGLVRAWDRGWDAFRKDPWKLLGATVCFGGILLVLTGIGFVAGMVVPLAANIIGLFVTSQLTAGLYLVFLQPLRGEPVNIQSGFRGFGPRYWQLTLYQVIQSVVMLGFAILMGVGMAPMIFLGAASTAGRANPPLSVVIALFAVGALVAIVAVICLFYFLVSWMFAAPLILDKGLDAWPAMKLCRKVVNRHPFRFSIILLVVSTFGMIGAVLCGVGMLVTGTAAGLMMASVYEDMFGRLDPRQIH
ncbi:MAG: GYF domain-containing protein [Verrucomicrobiota bacterium]